MALKRFYAVEDRISLISFAFKMSVAFITTIEVSIINKRCFFAFQPEGEWLWLAYALASPAILAPPLASS